MTCPSCNKPFKLEWTSQKCHKHTQLCLLKIGLQNKKKEIVLQIKHYKTQNMAHYVKQQQEEEHSEDEQPKHELLTPSTFVSWEQQFPTLIKGKTMLDIYAHFQNPICPFCECTFESQAAYLRHSFLCEDDFARNNLPSNYD